MRSQHGSRSGRSKPVGLPGPERWHAGACWQRCTMPASSASSLINVRRLWPACIGTDGRAPGHEHQIDAYGESKLTVGRPRSASSAARGVESITLRYFVAAAPGRTIHRRTSRRRSPGPLAIRAANRGTPLKVLGGLSDAGRHVPASFYPPASAISRPRLAAVRSKRSTPSSTFDVGSRHAAFGPFGD